MVLTYCISYSHFPRMRGIWWNKVHIDPVTPESTLLYYHSTCLCFDLFKSLFKGCVSLCLWAARALLEQPADWAHLASPQSDLQSYCIKRTIFITACHTTRFYLLHEEHNPSSKSSAPPLCTLKSFLGMIGSRDLWKGSLSLCCFWEVKMVFSSHLKFNQSVICLCWAIETEVWANTGHDCWLITMGPCQCYFFVRVLHLHL